MISRYGCSIEAIDSADRDGYFKALRISDNSVREYHLGDVRTENEADKQWLENQCDIVAELRLNLNKDTKATGGQP